MRRVAISRVAEAVLTIDFVYEEGARGPRRPVVRNVELSHITSRSSPRVMWIAGFDGAVIDNIRFLDSTFAGVEASEQLSAAGSVSFERVAIEPAQKARSANSEPAPTP